jgi:hypothetical protein
MHFSAPALSWGLLIATLSFMATEVATCWRLRKVHAGVWAELGRPTLLRTSQPQIRRAFFSWLRRRGDRELGDLTLSALVWLSWLTFAAFYVILVLIVLSMAGWLR